MANQSSSGYIRFGRFPHKGTNLGFLPESAQKLSPYLAKPLGLESRASGLICGEVWRHADRNPGIMNLVASGGCAGACPA